MTLSKLIFTSVITLKIQRKKHYYTLLPTITEKATCYAHIKPFSLGELYPRQLPNQTCARRFCYGQTRHNVDLLALLCVTHAPRTVARASGGRVKYPTAGTRDRI
jgi:hypothetical protein